MTQGQKFSTDCKTLDINQAKNYQSVMPKVSVKSPTSLSADEAYNKLKSMLDDGDFIRQYDSAFSCQFEDSSLRGTAKGKFFKGNFSVSSSGNGANVEINIDLPMTLFAIKGKVKSILEEKLAKALS